MHPEDVTSRGAGVLCLVGGVTLSWLAWHWKLHGEPSSLKAAFIGPTLLALGFGMLIHGRGIPTVGASRLTRVYGMAGVAASIVNLYLMGYFSQPSKSAAFAAVRTALPFAMFGVWLLPSRFFGAPEKAPQGPGADAGHAPPGTPIEPK
jgi:hypothetical protein